MQTQKNGFLGNIDTFLKKVFLWPLLIPGLNVHLLSFQCFKPAEYPEVLREYFEYVCQLEFKTKPDYKKVINFDSSIIFNII